MDLAEQRREILRGVLSAQGGFAAVTRKYALTASQSSYLSQLTAVDSTASFGELAARNWERRLRLPPNTLVRPDLESGLHELAPPRHAAAPYEAPNETPGQPNDLVITQYDAGGSMGTGVELEEKQPGIIKSWRVDQEWLRLNVKHHSGLSNLCIVTGFGPSMQPKYNPGDPLLMDRGVTVVDTEGIYFFRVANHGYIKQLQRIPTEDGLIIRAKSLNKDYDPFDITKKMDFEVFGKILTVWRSEQV